MTDLLECIIAQSKKHNLFVTSNSTKKLGEDIFETTTIMAFSHGQRLIHAYANELTEQITGSRDYIHTPSGMLFINIYQLGGNRWDIAYHAPRTETDWNADEMPVYFFRLEKCDAEIKITWVFANYCLTEDVTTNDLLSKRYSLQETMEGLADPEGDHLIDRVTKDTNWRILLNLLIDRFVKDKQDIEHGEYDHVFEYS